MSCDAVLTGTQDCVYAIVTIDGGAPRSGIALVTGIRSIPKVITASTLKEIAACGGHIAELRRRARKQRLREHRIDLLNDRVVGKITIANHGPDSHASVRQLLNFIERKRVDVQQSCGLLNVELHQINQRGSAGYKFGALHRTGSTGPVGVIQFVVFESLHGSGFLLSSGLLSGKMREDKLTALARRLHCGHDVRICSAATDIAA